MKTKLAVIISLLLTVILLCPVWAEPNEPKQTQEPIVIELPQPRTEGGMPLMQALKQRKTSREFSDEKLPMQVLSNMLWAACGVNRPDGKRTAPTAMNQQQIDVYVSLEEGLYFYDAALNTLKLVLKEDIREATGPQPFVKGAPVNLVFVC
ncbi:MAG: nitroreductase family protein, partial [Phycisphaerae bacterium]